MNSAGWGGDREDDEEEDGGVNDDIVGEECGLGVVQRFSLNIGERGKKHVHFVLVSGREWHFAEV